MLEIARLRANTEEVIAGLKKKRLQNADELVSKVLRIDDERRKTQTELNDLQAVSNSKGKEVGILMREGKREEAEAVKDEAARLKGRIKELNDEFGKLNEELTQTLYEIPNVPHESVPEGANEEDNVVDYTHGEIPVLENALPHWDLIKKYDIIDFELGVKITGAGFPIYKGKGAKLQRALVNFFLDEAAAAGYSEIQPPLLVNTDSGYGTGQLPDKEGQMYHIGNEDLYLIPTAEVPITNLMRNVIVSEDELPVKMVGYTPCFRREAGSWGAHVRGLNRLHQFDKVEIVQVQHPDKSYDTLKEMCLHVQGLLEKLELPYRVLRLSGGDISFNAALCFDMEVFSAAQERWLEVSSVSNFETFQANRLKLRFRDKDKNKHLAHTLNGSALALPRILAAILENNQSPEGIRIPKVLQPYCGFELID